jgi:hypothetical protein
VRANDLNHLIVEIAEVTLKPQAPYAPSKDVIDYCNYKVIKNA